MIRLFALVVGMLSCISASYAQQIEVFKLTADQLYQVPSGASVYDVDLMLHADEMILSTVEKENITDETSPKAQVLFRKIYQKYPSQHLAEAWAGLIKLSRYGLKHLPAVVIDGRAVVYGERDISKALGVYWLKGGGS